ncbi:MAG: 3-oxoacyl-[acyl-carrier-protein] reductase [Bdellovibrionales bacterium]|nr:3-oxoacyl-[acyl-carrier-protein] reductase [Bdellovibrionales bacterium]
MNSSLAKTLVPRAKRLEGGRILVTGSSRGIGAGIAIWLAAEGAKIVVTYSSNEEAAQKVVAELPGSGHICLPLNVADEGSVEALFAKIGETGGLTGLVNNAGITRDQLLLRMKADDFDSVIATNLRGTFLCSRAATKMMFKAKTPGSIVNITSVSGEMGNPGQANYSASKAGVEGFTKALAKEVAVRGIRANCIAPGFIATEMTGVLTDDQKTKIQSSIPMGTVGETEDIAAAAAFLLSDEARYITGHTLSVNGGMYM